MAFLNVHFIVSFGQSCYTCLTVFSKIVKFMILIRQTDSAICDVIQID